VDERFNPISGTERSFACDTVLIAVGLDPVNEFYVKAREFGLSAFAAGDAEEIAEASAAIFSGKIRGLEVARSLGLNIDEISEDWYKTGDILKSKPGKVSPEEFPEEESGVLPVLHCVQVIPCDPCTTVCKQDLIHIPSGDIRDLPVFEVPEGSKGCTGCERCVVVCPGLAVTLVDYRKNSEFPTVTIPYEFLKESLKPGDVVAVEDTQGIFLGQVEVIGVRSIKANDRTVLVKVKAPKEFAKRIAGIRVQEENVSEPMKQYVRRMADDAIICRCERVTAGEIRGLIRQGYRDISEIKAVTRSCMGSCGAKTCTPLIHRLFREEGIADVAVIDQLKRPLFMEVPLGTFAGVKEKKEASRGSRS